MLTVWKPVIFVRVRKTVEYKRSIHKIDTVNS
jgi:hypothetical protein